MSKLTIKWVHLSVNGQTCPRCVETGKEVQKAVETLKRVLEPLGTEVECEEVEITPDEFARNPLSSNEIWLNGKLLEEWLGAKTTQTPCCDVCGDAECRAVEIKGQIYEAVTSELIVKAGFIAASNFIATTESCCLGQVCCCC